MNEYTKWVQNPIDGKYSLRAGADAGQASGVQFERGTTPPNEWMREQYNIVETWRVYDTADNGLHCYLSPIRGARIHSSQAIAEVMRDYIGDWHASAELIRWDNR